MGDPPITESEIIFPPEIPQSWYDMFFAVLERLVDVIAAEPSASTSVMKDLPLVDVSLMVTLAGLASIAATAPGREPW